MEAITSKYATHIWVVAPTQINVWNVSVCLWNKFESNHKVPLHFLVSEQNKLYIKQCDDHSWSGLYKDDSMEMFCVIIL